LILPRRIHGLFHLAQSLLNISRRVDGIEDVASIEDLGYLGRLLEVSCKSDPEGLLCLSSTATIQEPNLAQLVAVIEINSTDDTVLRDVAESLCLLDCTWMTINDNWLPIVHFGQHALEHVLQNRPQGRMVPVVLDEVA
jgi:hypothetical protein